MPEQDLKKFLLKIENLNKLVKSLEDIPGRREELSSCDTHQEVVNLARSWGYEIGRQWGENSRNS